MDVSVIIVSYNSTPVLRQCLDSLRTHEFSGSMEVIVVDNASSDGTPGMVREEYPWVNLIAGEENLGYSKGVNIGIRAARGRYFFILNPDTAVKPDAIAKLMTFMDRTPEAGIVGPRLVFHDGNTQLSCRRFYTFKVLLLRRTPLGKLFPNARAVRDHLMLDFDHNSTREVDWLLGAAMFVRREAVENVGLMDERFFLYFEDVDWCYRMKQNGMSVFYHSDAVVTHGYQRDSAQSVLNRSFVSHLVSLVRYYEKWNFLVYFLKRYREVGKVVLFLLLDVVAFNAAFLSAYNLRIALGNVFTNPLFPIADYRIYVIFVNLLFVSSFALLGLYRIRRETQSSEEVLAIAKAIALASIVLMTSTYLGQIKTYSRLVVVFTVPFAVLYDWALRAGVRRLHRRLLMHKVDLKRACIIGPRDRARMLEAKLGRSDHLGVDVVGIVDTAGQSDGILTGSIGRLEDIESIVERERIQELIVLPDGVTDEEMAQIVSVGQRRVLDVTLLTDYFGLAFQKARIGDLMGRPVIRYPRDTRYALDRAIKRFLDVVAGICFLVLSVPGYVIYSLYALTKGAKPFTYSDRIGQSGSPISLPIAGADTPNGPSDFINLPLLWLIVIGKLSFVGPYPFAASDAKELRASEKFRLDVRPGVTGFWRMGDTDSLPMDDLLVQDASYVRAWSLSQDVKILFVTFHRMLMGRRRKIRVGPRGGREMFLND